MKNLNFAWGSLAQGRKKKDNDEPKDSTPDPNSLPKKWKSAPAAPSGPSQMPSSKTSPLIAERVKATKRSDSLAVQRNSSHKEDAALLRRHGMVILGQRTNAQWLAVGKKLAGNVLDDAPVEADGYYDVSLKQAQDNFYLHPRVIGLWYPVLDCFLGKNDEKEAYLLRRMGLLAVSTVCRKPPWPLRPEKARSRESAVAVMVGMANNAMNRAFGVFHVFVPLVELQGQKDQVGLGSLSLKAGSIVIADDSVDHRGFLMSAKASLPCLYWTYERMKPSKTTLRKMMAGMNTDGTEDDSDEEEDEKADQEEANNQGKELKLPVAACAVLQRSPKTQSWWQKKRFCPNPMAVLGFVSSPAPPTRGSTASTASAASHAASFHHAQTAPEIPGMGFTSPSRQAVSQAERIAYRERERQRFWDLEMQMKSESVSVSPRPADDPGFVEEVGFSDLPESLMPVTPVAAPQAVAITGPAIAKKSGRSGGLVFQ